MRLNKRGYAMPATIEKKEPMSNDVAHRYTAEMFAQVFRAFTEASDEVQKVIRSMCNIINDPEVSKEDQAAAVDTLLDALFPGDSGDGELGVDMESVNKVECDVPEYGDVKNELDQEEAMFAANLERLMDAKGFTQEQLANAIGVGQPAISMMLKRHCRPQKKTVGKIAVALGVDPAELWPNPH
jgi:lambda repressor-like predicted transcriptional regulator